ncbi:hypothetical protein BVRB_020070, partial [Beta vulgaris subsp. vulgaris]
YTCAHYGRIALDKPK